MFNISCSNVKCSNVKKVRIVEAGVNLIAGSCLLAISGSKEEINPVGGCLALKGAIIGVQELAPIPDWHNQLISIFGNQLDDLGLGSALLSFNRQVEGAFIISLSLAQLIGHTTAYCRDSHFVLSNNTAQEILGSAMIFLVVATATGFRLTNILDDEVDPLPDLAAMTLRTAIFAIPKIIADLVEHMCTTPPADPPAGSEGTHSLAAGEDVRFPEQDLNLPSETSSKAPPELSADNGLDILSYLIELENSLESQEDLLDQQSDSASNSDPPVESERPNDGDCYLDQQSDSELNLAPPVESERYLLSYLNYYAENNVYCEDLFRAILNANVIVFSNTEDTPFNSDHRALAFALSKHYNGVTLKTTTNSVTVSNLNTALTQDKLTFTWLKPQDSGVGQ